MSKSLSFGFVFLLLAACNGNSDDQRSISTKSLSESREENRNIPDWQITAKVKAALLSDSRLSTSSRFVSVHTRDGVVILSGTVPSQEEFRQIERKVASIDGVYKMDNQIKVHQ